MTLRRRKFEMVIVGSLLLWLVLIVWGEMIGTSANPNATPNGQRRMTAPTQVPAPRVDPPRPSLPLLPARS